MVSGLYLNEFSKTFCKLLEMSDTTCYMIGKFSDIDQGYLSRLKNGDKHNPSLGMIIKISLAFTHLSNKISMNDIEELFNSAGRTVLKMK
jgi:hypothetical protein